jgi:hypothetical protein
VNIWEVATRVGRGAHRGLPSEASPHMGPSRSSQQRRLHPRTCRGRTSPCAGQCPCVIVYGKRHTACSLRRPVMRYPSQAAASSWSKALAGGGGFPPRTSARAGKQDISPRHPPVLEPLWCQEAQKAERSPAAGATPGTLRASPGGHGSRATHNGGDAGSPRAGYGAVMWRSPLCGEDDTRVDSTVILMWISPHSARR